MVHLRWRHLGHLPHLNSYFNFILTNFINPGLSVGASLTGWTKPTVWYPVSQLLKVSSLYFCSINLGTIFLMGYFSPRRLEKKYPKQDLNIFRMIVFSAGIWLIRDSSDSNPCFYIVTCEGESQSRLHVEKWEFIINTVLLWPRLEFCVFMCWPSSNWGFICRCKGRLNGNNIVLIMIYL